MKKVIEAKLYPNKQQEQLLDTMLERCRMLYNHCLDLKIKSYKETGKTLHKYQIEKLITDWDIPSSVRNQMASRLDLAYEGFFRKGGFPRFKAYGRLRSFTFKIYKTDYRFVDGKIMFHKKYGFTPIKMRGLREFVNPREARVVKRASGWYFQLVDIVEEAAPKTVKKAIGVDYGLKHFVVDTKGKKVAPPKVFRILEHKLAIQQRSASKKSKGGKNRQKASRVVARTYEQMKNKRQDFLHKLSRQYADYDLVAVEKLNIRGMVKNHHLAKSISDASWGIFANMLRYKLKMLGGHFVEVNPYNTTQMCSACGNIVHKSLSIRTHQCECGLVLDRDENASRNILALGLDKAIRDGIAIASRVN